MNRKIFSACIAVSLILHALFLSFIQTHSLWFYSVLESATAAPSREEILKEAFSSISVAQGSSLLPRREEAPAALTRLTLSPQTPSLPSFSLQRPPIDALLSVHSLAAQSFALPLLQEFFLDLPQNLIFPIREQRPLPKFQPRSELSSPAPMEETKLLAAAPPPEPPTAFATKSCPTKEGESMQKPTPTIPLPQLPQLPSLADLSTINLSDAFEAELTFLPNPEKPGYLFALTLLPRTDLNLPKIHQRITFLIDRSNTVQQERLAASKLAVLRTIEELDPDDRFNIIAFDSKMDKLFPCPVDATPESIARAEAFLEKITLASFFSTSDLYKPLLNTIPGIVQEDELYTDILLTDGESISKKSMLAEWTAQNQGRVSLFAIGMETDSNLPTLETACSLNRGRLIQSSTQRGLKRQLLKLAKNIKTPVAKDLSPKAISRAPNQQIEMFPSAQNASHLYLDQPFVLIGTTETLDDFYVFIQGRLKEQWLNIKKPISFVHAKKGGNSLKTAFRQYEKLHFHNESVQ